MDFALNEISGSIAKNLKIVRDQVSKATRAGEARWPGRTVTLVAVSKRCALAQIQEAAQSGVEDFGENYVQEWRKKAEAWPDTPPRWHLIGPLQKNKAKAVVGRVQLIHTVDSLDLIDEISKHAQKRNMTQEILIQIKIGNEETKSGVDISNGPSLIEYALRSSGVRLKGLMTLPPPAVDEHTARSGFRQLVLARDGWVRNNESCAPYLSELSMGTSGDFLWAIEEGATIIRVGTAIFGPRQT